MKHLLTFTLYLFSLISLAQQGSVTEINLIQIRNSYDKNDASTKALTNALSNNNITKIALNRENLNSVDHHFRYKVEVKDHNGYLTFTDEWFNEYMFRVVVKKEFIDAETLKLLDQKPIVLPPWYPMFQADE